MLGTSEGVLSIEGPVEMQQTEACHQSTLFVKIKQFSGAEYIMIG